MPFHAKLNPPAGFRAYGANQGYAPSGEFVDGLPVHWFSEEGWGPSPDNSGFGHYAFRQVGDRQAEYAFYKEGSKDAMDGRGDLSIGPDGYLYITGNETDDDKLTSVYRVPGYVPLAGSVAGSPDAAALLSRIAALELKLSQIQIGAATDPRVDSLTSRVIAVEGVASKANERGLNALTQLSRLPAPGISREDAWQIAADRIYGELGDPQSGISGRVAALAGSSNVDTSARETANEALKRAGEAKTLAGQAIEQAASVAKQAITDWLSASVAYTDTRLLNLLWDRAVKLLRYKENTGRTAAQLPVNDQANIAK